MEKRLLLAVVLMAAAIMFTNLLFPPVPPPEPVGPDDVGEQEAVATTRPLSPGSVTLPTVAAGDSVVVESDLYRFVFSTRGAALIRAYLIPYRSYAEPGEPVQLVPIGTTDFLAHRLLVGTDTVDLRSLPYVASERFLRVGDTPESRVLEFRYEDPEALQIVLRYEFRPDDYRFEIVGEVAGAEGRRSYLLTNLGPGMEVNEHPDHHSERELAVVTGASGRIDRTRFSRIEGRRAVETPLTWAGIKDKYFLSVIIAGDRTPLAGAVVTSAGDVRRTLGDREIAFPRVQVTPLIPVAADGTFGFEAYLGPQDYSRLSAIGYDLEEVTPYGYRWLQPIIRPLAAAILWVLNALHFTLGIAYGWVLVIFGVLMRAVLWPLNAKAMRAQMRNMAVQPMLQELRDKYGNDPKKQQEAMVALYKEHGFNPFAGCLPLLVPMPVLITLFFVFQNTIAFRGAEFLWLPDLSLRDPLYILPALLVISMFALQWVMAKMSGIEQNPQMKMMMYFLPVMMGVIFFMLPAGLNLYYAVNQVASIPQQVLIAQERRRAQEELKKAQAPKVEAGKRGGGKGRKAKR